MSERDSMDFTGDTAPAIERPPNGRGPTNDHVRPLRKVDPHAERVGCYDDHAHDRISGHDEHIKQLWERVNGTPGADGFSQKQARYEAQLEHFASEVIEIKAAQKVADSKLDSVSTAQAAGFAGLHQALAERGASRDVWAALTLLFVVCACTAGVYGYKSWRELQRIEAEQ